MNKLEKLTLGLETKIPKQELLNPAISKSSVGWHIEHILLTINLIIGVVKKSNATGYRWKFNLARTYVFTLNKIPRGRGKAPVSVQPKNNFTEESLKKHLDITKDKIKELDSLKAGNYFQHPYFGKLNLEQTIKFLKIHTKHHLDIINDIIKSGQ